MATTTKKAAAKVGTKAAAVEAIKKEGVVATVGALRRDTVAEQIARTQIAIQEQLAEVSTKLTSSLATLEDVNAAIAIKKKELADLHEIDAEAITLDALKGEIEAARAEWAAEQARHDAAEAERVAELNKSRQRESDDFNYKLALARRKEADEYAATKAARDKADAAAREAVDAAAKAREADLKAREQELAALRQQVDGFPVAVKKEVDREVAVATNALKAKLETAATLAAKDAEVALKLASQETASARTEVQRLGQTITALQGQLAEAHKAAQSVAEKALDSASGRQSLETLQSSLAQGGAAAGAAPRAGR